MFVAIGHDPRSQLVAGQVSAPATMPAESARAQTTPLAMD